MRPSFSVVLVVIPIHIHGVLVMCICQAISVAWPVWPLNGDKSLSCVRGGQRMGSTVELL